MRLYCSGQSLVNSWTLPIMEIPQPCWATCASIWSPLLGKKPKQNLMLNWNLPCCSFCLLPVIHMLRQQNLMWLNGVKSISLELSLTDNCAGIIKNILISIYTLHHSGWSYYTFCTQDSSTPVLHIAFNHSSCSYYPERLLHLFHTNKALWDCNSSDFSVCSKAKYLTPAPYSPFSFSWRYCPCSFSSAVPA